MKHCLFTVFDQKAKAHLPPFTLPTTEMAIRVFTDCVNSPAHGFGKHPSDYTLTEHGTFDDNTGKFEILDLPDVIGTGMQYIERNPNQGQLDAFSKNPETQLGDEPSVLTRTKG